MLAGGQKIYSDDWARTWAQSPKKQKVCASVALATEDAESGRRETRVILSFSTAKTNRRGQAAPPASLGGVRYRCPAIERPFASREPGDNVFGVSEFETTEGHMQEICLSKKKVRKCLSSTLSKKWYVKNYLKQF